jgi:hypothetical protein
MPVIAYLNGKIGGFTLHGASRKGANNVAGLEGNRGVERLLATNGVFPYFRKAVVAH